MYKVAPMHLQFELEPVRGKVSMPSVVSVLTLIGEVCGDRRSRVHRMK